MSPPGVYPIAKDHAKAAISVHVKRVAGGLVEVLEAGGQSIETTRDVPFQVPDPVGTQLLKDGTGRFAPATAPKATVPASKSEVA